MLYLTITGASMYTVKIDISDWDADEFVTIETSDFDKVQLIQEFIEFQKENGWAADYEHVVEFEDEELGDVEEDEQTSDLNVAVFVFDSKKQIDEE
jgi:hypothetical protein